MKDYKRLYCGLLMLHPSLVCEWMDGWMDEFIDGWTHEQMDGRMDGSDIVSDPVFYYVDIYSQ